MISKKDFISLGLSLLLVIILGLYIHSQNQESPQRNILKPLGGAEHIGEEPAPSKQQAPASSQK